MRGLAPTCAHRADAILACSEARGLLERLVAPLELPRERVDRIARDARARAAVAARAEREDAQRRRDPLEADDARLVIRLEARSLRELRGHPVERLARLRRLRPRPCGALLLHRRAIDLRE